MVDGNFGYKESTGSFYMKVLQKNISIVVLTMCFIFTACGTKRLSEPERCEDLSTLFYDEVNPDFWSNAQQNAVARLASLEGAWQVTMECLDEPAKEATLEITEGLASTVELYRDVEESVCESFGKAVFEAKVTGSGDMDLDGTPFTLTADLLQRSEGLENLMVAASDELPSQYAHIDGFSFRVVIDSDGVKGASKLVTVYSDASNSVSVSRYSDCQFVDWVAR